MPHILALLFLTFKKLLNVFFYSTRQTCRPGYMICLREFLYFFLIWESQDPLDQFLPLFSVNDPDLFFQFLKERCLGTDLIAEFGYMRSFGRDVLENGVQYCHSDSNIFSGNIWASLYANMMKISQLTPEITRVPNRVFWMRQPKIGLSHRISHQLLE